MKSYKVTVEYTIKAASKVAALYRAADWVNYGVIETAHNPGAGKHLKGVAIRKFKKVKK